MVNDATHHGITWGAIYWPIAMIAVMLLFFPAETYAFFTNHSNTLSDYSWNQLGITGNVNPHNWQWWLSLLGWWGFVGIITAHIWFHTPA